MQRVLQNLCCCRGRPHAVDMPRIPASVERDYELLDLVGEGKTCRVMRGKAKAQDTASPPNVAIKLVATSYLSTPSRVDALAAEIRALSLLRTEARVLSLIGVYEDDAHVAIVTELVSGGELMAALGARKTLNEHTVRTLVRELVDVLAHMHSMGLTHRDLKPENMLLDTADHLKLIDFGVAHFRDTDGPMVGLCGTGPFMAPEVFDKETAYTAKVDVWSLGVCVFVLLTGHAPFEGRFLSQLEDKIRLGEYALPSHQQLSATARSFIATCLNVDVAERPTAKRLLQHPWLDLNQVQSVFNVPFGSDHMACIRAYAAASTAVCVHKPPPA
ncbi:Aste57867_9842 [Aphanomyces stellatus]|uniref:Aste57867_9842 protein n=1 Tax=Aphanomyces stellatus TaxID=120398 RepID=A0A485KNW2_9STRA|nr:hypothetical protein As57867_009803 [Aphanomyces stellatus]VFT86721.1 Aste57867_9842 [Aphanomyces stellatus]